MEGVQRVDFGDDVPPNYEAYPLHRAASMGNTINMIILLERGVSPNELNFDCLTPLHEACVRNRVECAEILLKVWSKCKYC
ncbi:hypothetical protein CDAR_568071 [Caerostris darwini]|uniref:Uncharacterized protein n=1 Tax=Caerostris darwini TaxID=1538125 RepID=A0AAV4R2W1_9ARAC|nr:hypothetical protein CDAR_568071 [Caerostris darwini]